MKKQPFTLLIHIALVIILAGAIITHFLGIQGTLTLPVGGVPVSKFDKTSGPGDASFPFQITLEDVRIDFYPGTTTPKDYTSCLRIDGRPIEVSMNNVAEVQSWRFYQSGISPDNSTLSVSHDPWGIAVTYTGYILLGVGFIGYFFQKKTPWRSLLRRGTTLCCGLLCATSVYAGSSERPLPCMQPALASNLGKAYVYWNGRICPLQTMAHDVTVTLYGGDSYRGMTPEQVLSGWLFYFDTWHRDYSLTHQLSEIEYGSLPDKKERAELERRNLIHTLGTGEAFAIYPYHTAAGHVEWLSLTGRRPSQMSLEQWKFMQSLMPRMKSLLLEGKNIQANALVDTLIAGQIKYGGKEVLPSAAKMKAERVYNKLGRPAVAGALCLMLGLVFMYLGIRKQAWTSQYTLCLKILHRLTLLYVCGIIGLQWWIGSYIPLSNGPQTMMFMSLTALIGALLVRADLVRGALLLIASIALFVAAMGGRTPQIGTLMPVLASPLLSVHVMLVMSSYTLFLLMAILSAVGLSTRRSDKADELCRLNRLILLPAVFLLAAGIFIGAVWANQSWGRYWGWDPKETCALVMLFVYSLPLHWGSRKLSGFRKPKVLHIYLLAAVFTVVFTYFGANYLLPGLHSYA